MSTLLILCWICIEIALFCLVGELLQEERTLNNKWYCLFTILSNVFALFGFIFSIISFLS